MQETGETLLPVSGALILTFIRQNTLRSAVGDGRKRALGECYSPPDRKAAHSGIAYATRVNAAPPENKG